MTIRPAPIRPVLCLPDAVRRGVDALPCDEAPLTLGAGSIDDRLAGRLARAALHEVFAVTPDDGCSATGFAVLLALRGLIEGKPVVWVREDRGTRQHGRLYPHGLAELGTDPEQILIVHVPDTRALLRAGGDIARCGAVGAVVIEPHGKAPELDLTASRRLSLAAARSGVMTLVLRVAATPSPSAAESRWTVAAAPSIALEGDAPGSPAFDVALVRHRGGIAGFETRLEWNRDRRMFRENDRAAPLHGGVPAVPAVGAGGADRRRAA